MSLKLVLIAEDDKTLREMLSEKLRRSGYEVASAENGEEALKFMKTRKPDVLLLDVIMPVKSGMEVLAAMNADTELKSIPAVVISNSGQPVEIEEARRLGARDFLIKAAFDPNEVVEKVKSQLGEL